MMNRPQLGITFHSHALQLASHPALADIVPSDVAHHDSIAGIRRRILAGEPVGETETAKLRAFIQRWDGKGYMM